MGPQHIAAENHQRNACNFWRYHWLQWGRSTSLRKTRTCSGKTTAGSTSLQWGRSTSLRKTMAADIELPPELELQWGRSTSLRKTALEELREEWEKKLQWGRSTSLRKTRPSLYFSSLLVPLQWGRSTSLRKTCPGSPDHRARSRGFNGAAAHRCGKQLRAAPRAASVRASMGPQHIAAENTF